MVPRRAVQRLRWVTEQRPAFGCEAVFEEQISSRKEDQPELRAAMDYCREGDKLVVWKLDRFGRSLRELINLANGLRDQGVEFASLRESIDTTTPGGKLVFHVFEAVAEFERDLILERTMAGLEAARARGRKGGRKPAMDEKEIAIASKLMRDRGTPIPKVCEAVGVSRATLYRHPTARRGRWREAPRRRDVVPAAFGGAQCALRRVATHRPRKAARPRPTAPDRDPEVDP